MTSRRLLVVGHAAAATGFSRVADGILAGLPGGYDLHQLGPGCPQPVQRPGRVVHAVPDRRDRLGAAAVRQLLPALRPDVVLVIGEVRSFARHLRGLLAPGRRFRTVLYAAVSRPDDLDDASVDALCGLDALVVFTEFARALVEPALAALCERRPDAAVPALAVIGHGVDRAVFRPLGDRAAARAAVFGPDPALRDAFVVLNANRNQPNKRVDLCVAGFSAFARGKPANVKLCLHMGTRAAAAGEATLVDRLGVRERLLVTAGGPLHPNFADAHLNTLYNACDIGVNTSWAEGWGLVAFEHAAAGAAQIVPGYGATAELWRDAAITLPAREPRGVVGAAGVQEREVAEVARALDVLYSDAARRDAVARMCAAMVANRRYEWADIGAHWHSLLQRLT